MRSTDETLDKASALRQIRRTVNRATLGKADEEQYVGRKGISGRKFESQISFQFAHSAPNSKQA